jgi:hypothetical protein
MSDNKSYQQQDLYGGGLHTGGGQTGGLHTGGGQQTGGLQQTG